MDKIREIALCFAGTAVFCSAAGLLCGNLLQKSSRYIIALVMLCSIVSAVFSGGFSFAAALPQAEEAPVYEELSLYEYQAEYLVGQLLSDEGIIYLDIRASANKTADGSIIISEIILSGVSDSSAARDILQKEGIDCRLSFT